MRQRHSYVFRTLLALALGCGTHCAQAQHPAGDDMLLASSNSSRTTTPAALPTANELTVYYGRVFSPEGPLPGAVVELANKHMVVCNADGEFRLSLPTKSGPHRVTVSFAGYADETLILSPNDPVFVVELTQKQHIKLAKGQDLKNYMRTAHRQIKKERRRL